MTTPRRLAWLLTTLLAAPASAGTLSVVHAFSGGADGSNPYKGLTLDGQGNLYGETTWGADACPDSYQYAGIGCGVVFKIKPPSTFSDLVTFHGASNGAAGLANVTVQNGLVYGSAYLGGSADKGLIFSVKAAGGGYQILHDFLGTDGAHPNSFPRLDASGTIFSTTPSGGPGYNGTDGSGNGVLFAIKPDHTFVAEHDFSGGSDGGNPGRIFLDKNGTIFGATGSGGSCAGQAAGCGVIYQFVPITASFTVLYTFAGTADGYGAVLAGIDGQGNIFGSTVYGGGHGYGTLFELKKTASGHHFKTVWAFTGGSDGAYPYNPPALGKNGTLVGTTFYGPVVGSNLGFGTLFSFAAGALTTLHTFTGDSGTGYPDAGGGYPEGTPVVGAGGVIFGTTAFGGSKPCSTSTGTLISSYGCGLVYSYTP